MVVFRNRDSGFILICDDAPNQHFTHYFFIPLSWNTSVSAVKTQFYQNRFPCCPTPEINSLSSSGPSSSLQTREGKAHFTCHTGTQFSLVYKYIEIRHLQGAMSLPHYAVKYGSEEYWRQTDTHTHKHANTHKSTHKHTYGRSYVSRPQHKLAHSHTHIHTYRHARTPQYLFPALPLMSFCELGLSQQQGIMG